MRFRHEIRYAAPLEDVSAMLADRAFREQVCRAQLAHDTDVRIDRDGASMVVVVDQRRPSDGIPGFARSIVGDEIRIVQREQWTDQQHADLSVTIPGKPGALVGSVRLAETGGTTVETVEGDLAVRVPLLGTKLEKLIADLLVEALEAEQEVGARRLGAR
ncbi:MAG TPA: DUF2505 domain-containing protein [Nocardioidaceae bacterium]|nr:DUF2505 domain-containing protein [Nocardioidaceae bacterium]